MQHYEGGSTLYGKYSSNLIRDDLAALAGDIAHGGAAPAPVSFDPRNGLFPNFTPYGAGAASGKVAAEPRNVRRLRRATFAWQGGERGLDRPLDRAFVAVQRLRGKRWRTVTDDLGLEILWRVDDNGRYSAEWQVPLSAPTGRNRWRAIPLHLPSSRLSARRACAFCRRRALARKADALQALWRFCRLTA